MKLNLLIGLVTVLALAGASSSGAQEPTQDLQARVAGLESELARSAEHALKLEQRTLLLERYVEGLAQSSAELVAALEASEAAGFTAGINPRSRELLLAGWRAHLATQGAGLPVPPAAPVPPAKGGRR